MLHFVFPPDGISPTLVDELFRPQAEALRRRGFSVSLVDDAVFRGGARLRAVPSGATVVYRGWMVRPDEYERFEQAVRNVGAVPLTEARAYRLTHHLPEWYPLLREFTAESVFISTAEELRPTLSRLNWGRCFLKDFVKSLKVDGGSIVSTPEDGDRWIREMLHYRDELEGGISIRRVEHFDVQTECRYFVFQGVPFAPDDRPIPIPVIAAAQRIASPLFTVDIAFTTAGECRIVELGDGQVSDLVGWSPARFAEIFATTELPTRA